MTPASSNRIADIQVYQYICDTIKIGQLKNKRIISAAVANMRKD